MPNWCENNFYLAGPISTLVPIYEDLTDGTKTDRLLNRLVPIGEWEYRKAVDTWGTKWDVDVPDLQWDYLGDFRAAIWGSFMSAWSPPIEAFATFCADNADTWAELQYYEPGMAFVGSWSSKNGDNCYSLLELTSKTVADHIPQELDDMFGIQSSLELWEEEENYLG